MASTLWIEKRALRSAWPYLLLEVLVAGALGFLFRDNALGVVAIAGVFLLSVVTTIFACSLRVVTRGVRSVHADLERAEEGIASAHRRIDALPQGGVPDGIPPKELVRLGNDIVELGVEIDALRRSHGHTLARVEQLAAGAPEGPRPGRVPSLQAWAGMAKGFAQSAPADDGGDDAADVYLGSPQSTHAPQ